MPDVALPITEPGVKAAPYRPTPAVRFKAWRLPGSAPRFEAIPVRLPDGIITFEHAAALATVYHRESIAILRIDDSERPERRQRLRFYKVKKRSTRQWVRGLDGKPERAPELYPDPVCEMCVRDFDPVEPWRVEDGNVAGHDLTLIEGDEL